MLGGMRSIIKPKNLLLIFDLLCVIVFFFLNDAHLDKYVFMLIIGLILIIYFSNYILAKISTGDNYIFLITSMLLSIGIITIFRIDQNLGIKQIIWSLVGILVFYLTYFVVKYMKNLDRYTILYYLAIVFLLGIVFILGERDKGAMNWIKFGGFSIQPSEFCKIIFAFFLASFYSDFCKRKHVKNPSLFIMGAVYFVLGILAIQTDLGGAFMFFTMFSGVHFIYEKNRKMIFLNIILVILGALIGYKLFSHVRVRVSIWRDPWADPYDKGRQIVQSLIAIAEGKFFGAGIGRGHPELITYAYSDLIFPALCEEMGLFTGIGIIMLFILFVYRSIKIALNQEVLFYRILALAICLLFGVQCFVNIGGVTKMIPLTGITLPFVSYGGSSMVSSFIALGVLQVTSEDLRRG